MSCHNRKVFSGTYLQPCEELLCILVLLQVDGLTIKVLEQEGQHDADYHDAGHVEAHGQGSVYACHDGNKTDVNISGLVVTRPPSKACCSRLDMTHEYPKGMHTNMSNTVP